MMHERAWTTSYKGQRTDAHWVIAHSHKTQSFMKKGGQRKCLDKALNMYGRKEFEARESKNSFVGS